MSGSDRSLVLVVGIGNPDRGDDGIGPTVARSLSRRVLPGVSVLELDSDLFTLIEKWDGASSVIVVDAVAPITRPGRIHRLDLAKNPLPIAFALPSSHAFGLAEIVELARSLQRLPPRLVAYLVEAEQFETGAPLSPILAKIVEDVAEQISLELPRCWETFKPKETSLMHETALVRDIIRRIDEIACTTNARRVIGAKIWLGALSHLSPGHFREHFTVDARGTLASGAVLEIEVSKDLDNPHAQHIRLESVDLDE